MKRKRFVDFRLRRLRTGHVPRHGYAELTHRAARADPILSRLCRWPRRRRPHIPDLVAPATGPRVARLRAVPSDELEERFQGDLQRYLFDQGVDFADQGREHPSARGRVDFFIRSGESAAVELKVFRDSDGTLAPFRSWAHQAARYPRDFGIRTAYLVVLGVSAKKEPMLKRFGASGSIVSGDLTIHVRICDLGRLSDSTDHTRKVIEIPPEVLLEKLPT